VFFGMSRTYDTADIVDTGSRCRRSGVKKSQHSQHCHECGRSRIAPVHLIIGARWHLRQHVAAVVTLPSHPIAKPIECIGGAVDGAFIEMLATQHH
jgi:hypothetical protein